MKKKSLLLLIPFAAAAAVALGSCGKDPAPQCDQASVLLDSQAISIEVGETKQLTASSNIEGCDIQVNWRSDDDSIASVDQNGVVTGHKNGSTTVYANDVPCLVTVGSGHADVAVESIELVKPESSSITMMVGDTQEILVNVLPENATNKLVNPSSSKESVVIINESGEIEAVGVGTAKVTIKSESNPNAKVEISVTVEEAVVPFPAKTSDDATLVDVGPVLDGASINFVAKLNEKYVAMDSAATENKYFKPIESSVENDVLTLGEGSGSFFVIKNRNGTYSFQTASGKYLAAKNNNNNLLEVDEIGPNSSFNVVIVDGEATITCIDPTNLDHNTLYLNPSSGSERFACYKGDKTYPKPRIYAKAPVPVPATGILLDETEVTMIIDDEKTLVAEVLPSYAIDKTVTWTTEGKGVVSVDNGKIKALAAGDEVVTATTVTGQSAKCLVHVYSEITHVDHVELNNETLTLNIDDISNSLTATVFPEDATFKGVTWSSSEEDIVTVDAETGELTAVGVGSSTITVTTDDGAKTASCVVSVNAASDGIVHAYEAAMAMEPGTGASEHLFVITGKVTFMPGNNLIVQDGDHSIIVYKNGQSGSNFHLGDTVTMRCQVQNYYGAAETAQITNNDIRVIEKDVTVNKGEIASSEAMEDGDFSNIVDFKNLVVKSKSEIKEGSDCSMKVTFEDNPEVEYTLFVKKSLYNADVAAKLNRIPVGGKLEVSNAYIGNYNGARQVCTGLESVVIDHTEYLPEEVVVKNGEEDVTSLNMVVNDEITLTASVLPVEASQEIVWSTEDNDGVVSVENGVVKALKAGTATVVAASKDGSKSKSIAVNVTNEAVHVTGVTLDQSTLALNLNDTAQLTATVGPEEATDKSVTWSVLDDSDVVSVDKGLVTALKVGTATVQVETNDGHFAASCVVTVTEKFIDVSEQDTYVIDKERLGLTNSTYKNSEEGADIAFTNLCYDSSSVQGSKNKTSEMHNAFKFTKAIKYMKFNVALDKPSATMDVYFGSGIEPTGDPIKMGSGTVYEFIAGNYILLSNIPEDSTCFKLQYTNGAVNFSSIEIGFVDYNVPIENIDLNKDELSLAVEESFTLEAILTPDDTTHTTLTYSSDHPEIASVTTDGLVIANAVGTATITVATDDPEISATCVVTVVAAKVPVTKVELTDHETEILQGGCTTLTATVSPDDATNQGLHWYVEEGKEDIISVDQDGCVVGLKPGVAKVIVKADDNLEIYDECEVTVEERFIDVSTMDEYVITAESLGLTEDYASDSSEYFAWTQAKVDKSENIQISGSTSPKSELHNLFGFSKDITYIVIDLASGATENATADLRFGDSVLPTENAVKLGKDTEYPLNVEGKIVIMAPEEGLDFFSLAPTKNAIYIKSITVGFGEYVEHVTGVELNKETTTIEEGASEQLIATVSPDNANDKSVTWTSSDESIATVDTEGNVTAVSAGEATITVKTTDGEFEANCVVTVVEKIIDVENITLDKETLDLVEGQDSTLVATVTPDNATHPEHTWSSSDETVATVDQDGKVTAVGAGEATITVKVDGDETKYAECVVTVTAAERQDLPYNGSFAFSDGFAVFPEGNWEGTGVAYYTNAYSFQAAGQYVQSTKLFEETSAITVDITALVNSETDGTGVLTVYALNDSGEVVSSADVSPAYAKVGGIDAGKAIALENIKSVTLVGEHITGIKIAYTTKSGKMFLFDVKVTDATKVSGVTLDESELTMELGETGTLVATVMPETASNKNYTFSSDHPEIVSVDANTGAIEAVGVGKATITVTTSQGSFTDTCEINVSESKVAVIGVEFAKDSITLATGDKETVDVTVSPADAFDKSVSYLSNNPSVATVDENGEITAVAPGTATITVTTTDGSFTDTCDVIVLTKATITNTNDFPGGSYDKNNYARYAADGSGLLFETYQVNKNSGTIQFQKNAGKLWNVSPISGLSEIRFSVSAGSVTVYAGDELKTTDNVLNPVDNVYIVPEGCSYFYIVGSKDAATNLSDIEIVCDEIPEYVIPVESVSLDKTTLDLTPTSEPVTLVPEINPSSVLNKEVIWSIKADSDDCISLENGVVTPKAVGTATVICTSAADTTKYAECVVTVSATEKKIDVDEVDTFTLTPDSLGLTGSYATTETTTADGNFSYISAMKGNSSIQMKKDGGGELHNNYAFSREIKYVKISITKAATDSAKASMFFGDAKSPTGNEITLGNGGSYAINDVGSIVIKPAAGSTYFSLKATNGTIYFASIEFGFIDYAAPALQDVSLDPEELEIAVGDDDVILEPIFSPSDAEPKSVSWSSDHPEYATVTNGTVHAVAAGTANITYTADGKTATCVVTVQNKTETDDVTITTKGFADITASGYQNSNQQATVEGVGTLSMYGYNGSTGQIRGSKTAIASSSTTSDTGNWHIYNTTELSGELLYVTITTTSTGSNKFQNNLYLVYGTEVLGDITALPEENYIAGTVTDTKITFDLTKVGQIKYFKICSKEKFTSGTVSGVSVTFSFAK